MPDLLTAALVVLAFILTPFLVFAMICCGAVWLEDAARFFRRHFRRHDFHHNHA